LKKESEEMLGTIIILLVICAVGVALKRVGERAFGGKKIPAVDRYRIYGWKAWLIIGVGWNTIGVSANHELVLRLPLLIFFAELSTSAWLTIAIITAILTVVPIVVRRRYAAPWSLVITQSIYNMVFGLVGGYLVVSYQSIWPAVYFHAALVGCLETFLFFRYKYLKLQTAQ
jgi:hypothetical protein